MNKYQIIDKKYKEGLTSTINDFLNKVAGKCHKAIHSRNGFMTEPISITDR